MSNTLLDRIALVTGGAQGLGAALCLRLAQEGCHVAVADLNQAGAEATAADIANQTGRRTLGIGVDVTSEASVEAMVQRLLAEFGQLDICVANAGVLVAEAIWEFPAEKWKLVSDVNLFGFFLTAKHAAIAMMPRKQGAGKWLADKGVMNVFAGVARGTMTTLDLSDAYLKDARVIGHSASSIEDLRQMLHDTETGELSPNRSVAAIGSLNAAKEGLKAVQDTTFPGKVVIWPQIKDFPLTALPDLKDSLPTVYAKLKDGKEWTIAAEEEFLRIMLP